LSSTPQIIDVYPAPDALGIPIGQQIKVTFNQEMDLTTLNEGTIVVVGPDLSNQFGPIDINPFDEPGFEDEDILSSPYVSGYVKGTISFMRVNASGGTVDDSEVDYTGAGDLWQTVAIFTPDKPLEPDKQYSVYVAGDEAPTDNFDSGCRTRTVFDTEKTAGTGTATITFSGGYTGDSNTTYVVRILSEGTTGNAEYEWWDANDPLTAYEGTTSTGVRELENGISIRCSSDGTFAIGDTFEVVVVPAIVLPNNYRWNFYTGSGSVATPPSSSSASGIDSLGSSTSSTSTFTVTEIDPAEAKYGVAISTDAYVGESITITFSDVLDSDTVADNLHVRAEPANGDILHIEYTEELEYTATVSANTISIVLDPGQLFVNNIVVITLDAEMASNDSVELGSEYVSYFSTLYEPLYASVRRIQLDLGPLISDVPIETIMFAILEGSIAADVLTFVTEYPNYRYFEFARMNYATCYAEWILLRGLSGDATLSDRMSKTLGDLTVSRGGGAENLSDKIKELEDCIAYWQVPLQTGGEVTPGASLLPEVAVKGSTAADNISVNRQWEPTSGIGVYSNHSAANDTVYSSGRRRLRTFRRR